MPKEKVVRLAEVSSNSKHWTPEDMLRDILADPDLPRFNKAYLVLLNDRDGDFERGFRNSGLSQSEAIGLLEIEKAKIIRRMHGED